MFSIYCVTNKTNGKVYVGQTRHSLEHRWKAHCKAAKYKKSRMHIANAIIKYGESSFTTERLALAINKPIADIVEKFFIKKYSSQDSSVGYNILDGGGGALGYKHTEDWKKANSERCKNRVLTEEWKQKISVAQKGRPFSEEHVKALREGQLGKKKKTRSPEHCQKISENKKAWWALRKGI